MKRRMQWLIGSGALLILVGAGVGAPHGLRRLDSFRVRTVEVRGTRLLAPHEALKQSGITGGANIFDDAAAWRSALERHPLVQSARIERVLPGTIRIYVVEAEAVALVRTPELRAVRGDGRILPVDPAASDLDLPIVLGDPRGNRDGRLTDDGALAAVRTLDVIRKTEPLLFDWISDAGAEKSAGIRLQLRLAPAALPIYVPAMPAPRTLRELRLALADLTARQELGRLQRIDARYRDQIVVALSPGAASDDS